MSRFTPLTDELHDYVVANGVREDEVLAEVRERTAAMGDVAVMQVAPDQGAFLTVLARAIGARRAIEVGTFTGYSAICIARGLGDDGLLVACELDPDRAEIARQGFASAGVADRIDLRVGPAAETLAALDAEPPYDLAFIDADKTGYPVYYERCLELVRPGGLILIDNTVLDGRVLEPEGDESATAIDELNHKLHDDERVDIAMVMIADGVTLARKREA